VRCARERLRHASAVGSTVAELAANVVERHRVASRKVGEARFDGRERPWIGEDLCAITPSGASGTKVTGTLYLDDVAYFEFGSIQDALVNYPQADEVAALPYKYTIK
jgi:hypothetical protein